jgi:hypothetical protein
MIICRKVLGLINLMLLFTRRNLWRIHPRPFIEHADTISIRHPIFLLGTQGGGLTLLSRMLHRHPDAVYVTGNSSYWAGPDEMQNVMGSFLPPELAGLRHKAPSPTRFPKRDDLYAIDELLPLYRKTAADATPEMGERFKQAIRLAILTHARDRRRARFVDKSQIFTVRLSLVNHLLEGCRPHFVLVTRNPYAMCYRAATAVTRLSQLELPLDDKLHLAAQHWANSFQSALEDAPEVNALMTLRFEDLLNEPEKWLQKTCSFARLEYHPNMLPAPDQRIPLGSTGSSRGDHKWHPLRTDVNHRYLGKLEPWMIEIMDSRVRELAGRWGYSAAGP